MAANDRTTTLSLDAVRKDFGGITAVDDLSLDVSENELLGLIGPNGAGKSTLINLISGKLPVSSGSIRFNGDEISHLPQHDVAKQGVSRTYQVARLFPEATVYDNIRVALYDDQFWSRKTFFSILQNGDRDYETPVRDAINLLQIDEDIVEQKPDQLSHLERRKVALARSIVQDSTLLLLDEPFAGLTASEIEELRESIRTLNETGKTIIIVDHNIDDISNISGRLAVMGQGSILREGSPEAVLQDEEVRSAYLGE